MGYRAVGRPHEPRGYVELPSPISQNVQPVRIAFGKVAGLWRSGGPVITVIRASKKPRAVQQPPAHHVLGQAERPGFAAGEEGEALITTIQIKEIEREVG